MYLTQNSCYSFSMLGRHPSQNFRPLDFLGILPLNNGITLKISVIGA